MVFQLWVESPQVQSTNDLVPFELGEQFFGAPWYLDHEFVEAGCRVRQLNARDGGQLSGGVMGLGQVLLGQLPQSMLPQQAEINGDRKRAQRLVGADVRGGLLAPDVLFARGER